MRTNDKGEYGVTKYQSKNSLVLEGEEGIEPMLSASVTVSTGVLGRKWEAYGVASSV